MTLSKADQETRAEAKADAAEAKAHAAQKPSVGRIVIVRHSGQGYPAIIVQVREDESIDVQIFKADHTPHGAHAVKEVDPDTEGGDGWHWPARV
jgi:hypothetical protein